MRQKNEPLPSKEETERETKKRLEIMENILPKLKFFSEAIILCGSVAFGKNYVVRKESDIDLLLLIDRENVKKLLECEIFTINNQIKEAIDLFEKRECDVFSILEKINSIDVHFHFWDKQTHFNAELFKENIPIIYDNINLNASELAGTNFSGEVDYMKLKNIKKTKYAILREYPPYFIKKGELFPRTPILNLITDPDILFVKDKRFLENIEQLWKNLTKRLIQESEGEIDLNKKNIIFAQLMDIGTYLQNQKKN